MLLTTRFAILAALAFGTQLAAASAMVPQRQFSGLDLAAPIHEAKIVCEPNGYCYRPPARHKAARWIYGDDTFVGPYYGPGNYGWPGHHHIWWPFGY